MRLRTLWLAAAFVGAACAAQAQPFQGLYVGAGAGYNLPENWSNSRATVAEPKGGAAGLASIGYALGNGFRFEIEGNYRWAGLNREAFAANSSGSVQTYGAMANVLFDIDVGAPWIYPYIGGGAGYAWTNFNRTTVFTPAAFPALGSHFDQTQGGFAFQAIGGLSFPMPGVPGLSLTTEYRFFGKPYSETFDGTQSVSGLAAPVPIAFKAQSQSITASCSASVTPSMLRRPSRWRLLPRPHRRLRRRALISCFSIGIRQRCRIGRDKLSRKRRTIRPVSSIRGSR